MALRMTKWSKGSHLVADSRENFYAGRAMRPQPRTIDDEAELYAAALRALMRRAHSTFEMRTYLERRAVEPESVRRVMARLKQEKLIDDAKCALDFARARATGRRQGGRRIAQELRKRGVPDQHIDAAIAQVFSDLDEAAIVRKVIERRKRTARGPFDERKVASLYRTLLRAGFDPGVIRRELRAAPAQNSANDVPDFASPDEGD
jgi:regulatory protein